MNSGRRIIGLEQNTPQWKAWRETGIGGSDAPVVYLGNVFGKTPFTLWRQKTGGVKAEFTEVQQAHLDRGNALEPVAREEFINRTGIYVAPVCMQSREHPFMLASLDGLNTRGDIVVEIKSPAEKMFRTMLEQGTPEYYDIQIQHQLYVSGARECYFWAYNPEIEPHVFIERHTPDAGTIRELIAKESEFQRHVEFGIPPAQDGELGISNSGLGAVGVVMLAGYAKVGKDTIGQLIIDAFGSRRFAFADPLKNVYQALKGLKREELDKDKELHRPALITLGHGMRAISPDVWVDGVFAASRGEEAVMAATQTGAIVTDCRYVNEAVSGRRFAEELGVPFRLIWIERPGVKAVHETEEKTTSLLRNLADFVVVNDVDINTDEGKKGLEDLIIHAFNSLSKHQRMLHASYFAKYHKQLTKKSQSRNASETNKKRMRAVTATELKEAAELDNRRKTSESSRKTSRSNTRKSSRR